MTKLLVKFVILRKIICLNDFNILVKNLPISRKISSFGVGIKTLKKTQKRNEEKKTT